MDDKCYRVVAARRGVQPIKTFVDRIYAEVPAERPDHPSCYEGEWVCSHTLCPVQAVRLRVKAFYHQHLPRLRCPLCLRQLDFRHWLAAIALQEVPSEPEAKKPRRALTVKRSGVRCRKGKAAPQADTASAS